MWKSNAIPLQAWICPYDLSFMEFLGDRHMVVTLLAPHTGRLYAASDNPGTDFC